MIFKLTVDEIFRTNKPINTQLIKYMDTKYHSHEFIEFFYVIDGEATHLLNNKKNKINHGNAFLLLPSDVHSFIDGDASFIHRDIDFKIDFFKEICNRYSPALFDDILLKKYPLCFTLNSSIETKLEKLLETYEMNINNDTALLEKQIGFEIIGSIIFSDIYNMDKNNNNMIARLVKVLSSPSFFKYSINEILEMENFGYCREHVCRLFKKKTGSTMSTFFNTSKIEYAIALKQTGFYTTEEIRNIINIDNESYYYKLLKKHKISKNSKL